MSKPIYKNGDLVSFRFNSQRLIGKIKIVSTMIWSQDIHVMVGNQEFIVSVMDDLQPVIKEDG
jgi:hypothetical protein